MLLKKIVMLALEGIRNELRRVLYSFIPIDAEPFRSSGTWSGKPGCRYDKTTMHTSPGGLATWA